VPTAFQLSEISFAPAGPRVVAPALPLEAKFSPAFTFEYLPAMSDVVTLYDEATRLKNEGRLDDAAAKLKEAVSVDDTYALAHSALAVVLQRQGQHEEAIAHARRVTELEPNDPFSFTALSVTYQRAFAGTQNMGFIRLAEDAMERSRQLTAGH
jgi:tetratricopeptide (TPR) repeat protein